MPNQSPKALSRSKAAASRFSFARRRHSILAFVLLAWVPAALAASLTASLDRNVVPLGESVTFSLIFEGVSPGGSPNLPALPNLTVAPGINQRSEFTFVNGQQTAKQIFDYTLTPTQVGNITIPALQFKAGNQVLASQPVTLKVVQGTVPGGPGGAITNLAFLRLVVPKNEVYIGEPFPIEIHLYFQYVEERSIQMPQLKAEGFSLGQFPQPAQSSTRVGGVGYNLLAFKTTATAAKTGQLNLGPVECPLTALVPLATRRRDPFDPFGFFGSGMQRRPMRVVAEAQPITVLPLPAQNVPGSFNGAIGRFQLSVSAGPTELAVGDPLTVKVQIAGNGRIEALTLPEQPQWKDFKTYPPTSTVETRDPLGLSGVKSFTQVVMPQNHEITQLPPLQFSFFDPTARSYRTLAGPAIPLKVRPTTGATAPPPSLATNLAQNSPPPADDILNVKTHPGRLGPVTPLLAQQSWFLSLHAIPVLGWLSLLIWRKRTEALANNPRLRRQREVALKVREGLKDLHAHAAARKSDDFFATLFHLLQEQLGERLDLPASAITEAVIDERLRPHNLSDATLNPLRELFQTCNAARYAPMQTKQALEALIPKLAVVLDMLQNWEPEQ